MNGLIKFNGISQFEAEQILEGYPSDFVADAFKAWTTDFEHRVSLSYIGQIRRYEEYVTRQYVKSNNLPDPDSMDEWQMEAYRDYLDTTELPQMHSERETWTYYLNERQSNKRSFVTDVELYDDFIAELMSGKPSPRATDVQYALWGFWFDATVNNPPDKAKSLRAMPYKDYLLTPHWRRVKEAIMVAYQARCQADKCLYFDEGFWLDTRMLHVHHVSYKNRGNERFSDLRLLCDECHQKLHAGDGTLISDHDFYNVYLKVNI